MNYFLLTETEFSRRVNEAGDCNMETAYTAFATQVIELCSGNIGTNRTIIALAYIEIELQHYPMRSLPEEKREVAAYISKALPFMREMRKFLAAPRVPPLIPIRTSSDNTTENPASPLQWTGNAIDLVELIYGISEMGCTNNGNIPPRQLAPLLCKIFEVGSKDCYHFYIDIKRWKNESRAYFFDRMQEKLSERMLRDEEMKHMGKQSCTSDESGGGVMPLSDFLQVLFPPCRYVSLSIRLRTSEKHYLCTHVTELRMSIGNLDIIRRLIAEKEYGRMEFEETIEQLERGMGTLCALLNEEDDTVLFGVTDKGKIVGQDISDKTRRDIANAIRRIRPFATVEVSYAEVPDTDKGAVVLSTEEQRYMRPFSYKGQAYLRVESATSTIPQEMYSQYLIQRGGRCAWEAVTNPNLKISNLDERVIISAVHGGVRSSRLPEATIGEDLPVILERSSLLHGGKLNSASAVLFGRDFYYYPQCLLRLAHFKGTTEDEFIDDQRVAGNIYALLDTAMALFFKHLSLSGKIERLYHEEELGIPYEALGECCTNALCHRSYHRPGSSVGIAIYDDHVEIENNRTFPPGMTMEKLLNGHNSEPQNLIIASVLYKSEILESWGRSIGLTISECRHIDIPDPGFRMDGNGVWATSHYVRKTVGYNPTAAPQSPDSYPTATPQVGKVLSAIEKQMLSAKEIMGIIGLKDKGNFLELYLYPAIRLDLVEPIYPEKPKYPRQKYRLIGKGLELLKRR